MRKPMISPSMMPLTALSHATLYDTLPVMTRPVEMVGKRFGRLLVSANASDIIFESGRRLRRVIAKCDCGTEKTFFVCHLRSNKTQSCGCLRKEVVSQLHSTHGDTRPSKGKWAPEYGAWSGMIQRCENLTKKNLPYYAGIKVCKRWRESYEAFLTDMGRKPSPKHSIDRIDSTGNYEPSNCRWATASEQRLNSRNPKRGRKPKR
jgi:hypothetical protein